MGAMKLKDLAALVDGTVEGDPEVVVREINGIADALPGQITFLANGRYSHLLPTTRASAVILDERTPLREGLAGLRVRNPDLAFARVAEALGRTSETAILSNRSRIHPAAIVSPQAKLGRAVAVGPLAVIEAGATIGDGAEIGALAYIGAEASIGRHARIFPRVVIRERCVVGERCILHAGAVIGSDGFGYVTQEDGRHVKIPQVGNVVLEDDVEIGANTTIDRARFDRTLVKRGAKIDNLVMIAHNVVVGENTLIAAQTGIAGSTKVGSNVVLAGQAGVGGHVVIGDRSKVAGQAGVAKSIPPESVVSGTPARPHDDTLRDLAALRRIPELLDRIRTLERELENLKRIHAPDEANHPGAR